MTTYREQWKDPRWQKRRLEALEKAGWQCENCGDKEATLNVHHRKYIKGRSVWDYDLDLLAVFCERCHEAHHRNEEAIKEILAVADSSEIFALLAGYFLGDYSIDPGLIEEGRQENGWFFAAGFTAKLCNFIKPSQMKQVAQLAVELSHEGSEARPILERDNETVFDHRLG